MKLSLIRKWTVTLVVAVLPLAGCVQQTAHSAEADASAANQMLTGADPEADADTAINLEEAPGRIVSTAAIPTSSMSPAAAEIVKLMNAGVDENVILSYVTNSASAFHLTSDDIIYLNDVGLPSNVVAAMLQRDQALGIASSTAAPPVYTNQLVPTPGAPAPYTADYAAEGNPAVPPLVEAPLQPQVNVSYTYFYDSLAPYGNWIQVDGYGLCWQPTVVAHNPGWQPYMDRGRWVYTTQGWYWASDYSWGWAPFHYGRWFNHRRWGWCWAPDTVWGPSWVTWRYTSGYCGWAPLPPAACYTPGFGFTYYGRSVGFNFSFGLHARHYAFVPVDRFCDRYPYRHRVPRHNITHIYNNTTVVNQIVRGNNNTIINHGIPVRHIETATRTRIRETPIREIDRPTTGRFERHTVDRSGTPSLAVYRPNLPVPTSRRTMVGEGVRPADRDWNVRRQALAPGATAPASGLDPRTPGRDRSVNPGSPRDGRADSPVVRTGRNPLSPAATPPAATVPGRDREPAVRDSRVPATREGVTGRQFPVRNVAPSTSPTTTPDTTPRREVRTPETRTAPLILRGQPRTVTPGDNVNPGVTPNREPGRGWNQNQNPNPPSAVTPAAPDVRRAPAVQPSENTRTVPGRQFTPAIPQTPASPVIRQQPTEQPRTVPQRQNIIVRPQNSVPTVQAPVAPVQRWTPPAQAAPRTVMPQPQSQQPRSMPPAVSSAPVQRQMPQVQMPAGPRFESRQTPPAAAPQINRAPQVRNDNGNRGNAQENSGRGRR